VPLDGVFPLAPSYDHAGPLARDVAGCVRAMAALAPGLDPAEVESLADVQVGIAWCEHADPLVRARVEAAGALFPRSRRIAFPEPAGTTALLMREVADVHRDLYAEHADLYGENIRPKIERCLVVSDAEAAAAAEARRDYERGSLEALAGCDLLLTPTLAFVPPPADIDELGVRAAMIRFTYPFDALGWPALALPCGPAEDGLPASVQLCGRREDDALVLAAGLALERALAPTAPEARDERRRGP
jgi:Asp-tRNA(Asn)/Glu-tRNA(Gln) amidotransferase A subunit family amidase